MFRFLDSSDSIEGDRDSAIVCIPVVTGNQPNFVVERALLTIRSVLSHTDPVTPIVIVGSTSSMDHIESRLATDLTERTLLGLAVEEKVTIVEAINTGLSVTSPADVILVVPGICVSLQWFRRLREAALCDSTVASASPLSGGGGALGMCLSDGASQSLHRSANKLGDLSGTEQKCDEAEVKKEALVVAKRSLMIRPRIATMGPGCVYMRRAAVELTGPLDERDSLGNALAASATEMIALGMVHVAADDVLVVGQVVYSGDRDKEATLVPEPKDMAVGETIYNDESGSLRRAKNHGHAVLRGLSVTIDGRALVSQAGGTQTYIMGLIMALAREQTIELRVVVAPDISDLASEALATLPNVQVVSYEQAIKDPRRTDVVHRPQQIFTPDDLALLRLLGNRVVVTQQDLIAYHNYSYHCDIEAWRAYRRTTRFAMAGADQVVFFSNHARRDALAEDLLAHSRTHVVGIGADQQGDADALTVTPNGFNAEEPFLLCLGANYAHKNRPFAIQLFQAVCDLGWEGRLVLAGSHVPYGSSRERERILLDGMPELSGRVLDLGPIDDPTKRWLYERATAIVYPTLYEGYGLMPVEAAKADLPCLFAAQAALTEVAGSAATLVPWDAYASARAVMPLLGDGAARSGHLAALRALGAPSWAEIVGQMLQVYEQAIAMPPSEAAPHIWQELNRENHIVKLNEDVNLLKALAEEYQDAYHSLDERVKIGLPLIDKDGLLSRDEQRGLMRIASRRRFGNLVLKPFGLLGRFSMKM